ncbi:hypothetical protein TCAL_01440 [Tigriopus californicus]|uniref:RING-type E3 ubiquitin transferase n=1 Tax=Tigriopus californicus TaxID=6832 RepID=A0A553N6H7_TIGCA|nr:hypothetical protein TCAL_01440 [Tigriopus californicus]
MMPMDDDMEDDNQYQVYSPDMPKRLPLSMVLSGFVGTVAKALRFWLHYTLVALAWLGVVPLTACRIYRTLFTGSVSSILSLPISMFSTENITWDILKGCVVVSLTLMAFIGLVWLREQILHGGGPEWLEIDFPDGVGLPDPLGPDEAEPDFDLGPEPAVPPVAAAGDAHQPDLPVVAHPMPVEPAAPEIDPNMHVGPLPPLAAEAVAPDEGGDAGDAGDAGDPAGDIQLGEDGLWNPMEWDRAVEELTWERLLGLDGSLVFLEHVFWVVSLNTLFILVFAFCPYHIGHFTLMGFKLKKFTSGAHFEGMLITLCGYCVIGLSLVGLHLAASIMRFRRLARIMGLCYVVVKVALLIVIEILTFPMICGYWLDICSLALFDATLKDRQNSYHQSPMTSIFIHWMAGSVFVFYFASFVILIREVVRPGVLWFLRNLNDPDFNPIQEMIHLPILCHLRRFCLSVSIFGMFILVMLYLPSRIIKNIFPKFLPYQTAQVTESQIDELAMELFLLLVILPAIQDQYHMQGWLKASIKAWCDTMSWIFNLRSYLFGDPEAEPAPEQPQHPPQPQPEVEPEPAAAAAEDGPIGRPVEEADEPEEVDEADEVEVPLVPDPEAAVNEDPAPAAMAHNNDNNPVEGLGHAHQALLQRQGPSEFQPYLKPSKFPLRIAGLIVMIILSLLVFSLACMLMPVWVGRQVFSILIAENQKVYELYTAASGLYVCLVLIKGITLVLSWTQQGWEQMSKKITQCVGVGARAAVALVLLVGVIPLMFGFLLDVVVLIPLRVPVVQSPIYFLWQDWALGAMYTKISEVLVSMGPDWWLKAAIERFYNDGLRGVNLSFLISSLVMPVCATLGLALAVPYVVAHSLAPLILSDEAILISTQRRIYPVLLILILVVGLTLMQLKQCRKLYEHIKNDRYLVGRRLVNHNHPTAPPPNAEVPPVAPVVPPI